MFTQNMNTQYTIKSAIQRSISHNEIVKLEVADVQKVLEQIRNDENATKVDRVYLETGLDCWGEYNDKINGIVGEFRILIVAE